MKDGLLKWLGSGISRKVNKWVGVVHGVGFGIDIGVVGG